MDSVLFFEGYFVAIPKDIVGEISKFTNNKSFPLHRFPDIIEVRILKDSTVSCSPNVLYCSILSDRKLCVYSIKPKEFICQHVARSGIIRCHTVDDCGNPYIGCDGNSFFYIECPTRDKIWYISDVGISKAIMEIDSYGDIVVITQRSVLTDNIHILHGDNVLTYTYHNPGNLHYTIDFASFNQRFTAENDRCLSITSAGRSYVIMYAGPELLSQAVDGHYGRRLVDSHGNYVELYPTFYRYLQNNYADPITHRVNYNIIKYSAITPAGDLVVFVFF